MGADFFHRSLHLQRPQEEVNMELLTSNFGQCHLLSFVGPTGLVPFFNDPICMPPPQLRLHCLQPHLLLERKTPPAAVGELAFKPTSQGSTR